MATKVSSEIKDTFHFRWITSQKNLKNMRNIHSNGEVMHQF